MGGALVGTVDSVTPARDAAGQPIAVLNLKLNKSVQPLPVDSTFDVRLKGAIGLKYLADHPGHIEQTCADGATVPLSQAHAEVDLDQVLSMFDAADARRRPDSTIGFSDALAGRGADINDAIGAFVPLLTNLGRWRATCRRSSTDLGGFFRGLESFSSALVPVAQTQADAVREPRHDVPRARERRGAVPAGLDLRDAADVQRGDRRQPRRSGVPAPIRRGCSASCARASRRCRRARRCWPTRSRSAPRTCPATIALDQRLLSLAKHAREPTRRTPAVTPGLNRLTLTAIEPALAAGVPDAGADGVQLRDAVPAQHLEPAVRARRPRGPRCGSYWSRSTTCSGGEAVPSQQAVPDAEPDSCAEHGPAARQLRYPNTAAPGQTPDECAAGNEPYSGTGGPDRQPAGQPRAEDRDDDEEPGREAPPATGLELRRRGDRRGRDRRRLLPRVRRRAAVRRLAVRAQGGVHARRPSCTSRRRSGSPASTSGRYVGVHGVPAARRRRRDDGHRQQRPADPRGRDGADPPADLPRGQLLRRPAPGQPERADARLRARRCRPPTRRGRCSSTACCPRSTPTRARTCRRCSRASAARSTAAERGAGRDPGPIVRGLTGGQALNPSLKYSADAFRGLGDRQPGAARNAAA